MLDLAIILLLTTICCPILAADFVRQQISLPPELLFERSCKKVFMMANSADWRGGCECTIARRWGRGAKCCCVGAGVKQIAAGIDGKVAAGHSISTIFLFNVSVSELALGSFSAVPNLEELFVDSCLQLAKVDSKAFARLQTLRKIRVTNCPNLVQWEGTMLKDNPLLQSLIVHDNGLRELPPLEMEPTQQNVLPMERVDFSGNCIRQIGTGAMRNVAAKSVLLNGNAKCLRTIGATAFPGCKFVTLQLSDNVRLDQLHPDSFAGLLHLEHLDLSGSAIYRLPHAGLRPLKRLTLRAVPRLKQLPPVLAFPNLVQADFTYSHHCCFFKYASRDFHARKGGGEDEDEHLTQNYREIQSRMCKETNGEMGEQEEGGNDGDGAMKDGRRRQRRHVFVQDGGDELFKELAEWYRKVELQPMKSINGTAPMILDDEMKPFTDAELGKGFRLERKCDRNAAIDRFYLNISCTPQPDALNPCEDIVSNLPLRVVIWPMWIGAILGNLAVWAVISAAWQRKMRLHYLFMLNLSLADFLTGVYLAILAFTDIRTANEYYNYAVEWQTGNGCAFAGFLSVFASELSIFSMLMIALEIFYNSRFAFYGRHLSPACAGFALLFGYVYALGMASLPLFGISSFQHSSICLPLHIHSPIDKFYLLFGLSLSGLAFGAMVVLYVLLNCTLRRSKATSTTRAEEDRQILRRTLVLIGTDMLCWVPTLFFGLTAALGWPLITLSSAKWCLVLFYPINSCANPLLYVFLTRTWRDAKRKAGPLIRRSLAASASRTPRGTLSWHKFERFYSNGPKLGNHHLERLLRMKMTGGEEEGEEEGGQRPNTIHCCEERGQRKALEEIFVEEKGRGGGGGRDGKGKMQHRRRASDGDAGSKRSSEKCRQSSQNVAAAANPSSSSPPSTTISAARRKSLLPRSKISAPPQMSDISESSTSLGSSNHIRERKESTTRGGGGGRRMEMEKEKMAEKKKKIVGPKMDGPKGKRGSDASSNVDGDSGRGDSLRSWAVRSVRPSVVSLCWEGIGRSPLLMAKCPPDEEEGTDPREEECVDGRS